MTPRLPRGLPHLLGWRGTVVRALFAILAALTFVHIVGSTWFNARDMFVNVPAAGSFGFRTYSSGAIPITGEALSAEARASGLPLGALFVSIDGEPVSPHATEFTIGDRLSSDADGRLLLVLKAEDGAVSRHRLTRHADYWTMIEPRSGLPIWLYSTFNVVMFQLPLLILFGIALALVGRRPRDPEALLIAFSMLLFCFTPSAGFWLAVNFGIPNTVPQTAVISAFMISMIALAGFPDGRFTTWLARVTVAGLLLVLVMGLAGWFIWTPSRIRSITLNAMTIALAAMALVAMVMRYRASAGGERQQVKWAMLGFGAGTAMILAGVIGELSGMLGPGRGTLAFILGLALFSVGQVLGPIGLLVSLLRYRLYDAESAISRSVAYAALTVALVAIFAASEKLIELTSEQYFGGRLGVVAGGFGAALAAVMVAPLHRRLHGWAEHRFQKKLIRLRHGLPPLVGDLRETATLAALADAAIERIAAGVPATGAAIVVDGTTIAARGDTQALPVTIPLAADGVGEIGQLRLGARPDGSTYGKDESETLNEIADPLARAIAVVQAREAADAARAAETRGLSDRIGRLEQAIARLLGGERLAAAE